MTDENDDNWVRLGDIAIEAVETARNVSEIWGQLKPALRRSLGPRGAAEWLAFAAQQERLYAERQERNVIDLKPAGWTP